MVVPAGTGFVPEAGDVIVVPEARESRLVYAVHVEGGGGDQLIYHNRAEPKPPPTHEARASTHGMAIALNLGSFS